eukprot:CAMPEP_0115645184 /NCGR_PEP_ID=MMETSP0272-20121206/38272_1 /TAXON_ID=71861 /ORGANISM="Scrippsiella trochoidea, Strain CCMP3099" /LENGTH=47 /DNA_ID= /DNA_START= /DNA_END= /DNA_ORIENTATION=
MNLEQILPSAEPISVAVPVMWVVRSTAPLQDVIIAFWRPIAAASISG